MYFICLSRKINIFKNLKNIYKYIFYNPGDEHDKKSNRTSKFLNRHTFKIHFAFPFRDAAVCTCAMIFYINVIFKTLWDQAAAGG